MTEFNDGFTHVTTERMRKVMTACHNINTSGYSSELFKLVGFVDLTEVKNLNSHTGAEPSIELGIGEDEEIEHELVLVFASDMERENFID